MSHDRGPSFHKTTRSGSSYLGPKCSWAESSDKMEPHFLDVSVLIILCFLIQTCIGKGQENDIAGFANSLGSMFSGLTGVGSDCSHTCPKGKY